MIPTIRQERKKYALHRQKARSNPEKYITIIIDGMDQSKTNLPCLCKESKSSQALQKLRTHLTGVLVHTRAPKGKICYGFYDLLQWPHDSNMTIAVLLKILHQFKHKLPPVLYLQLDNTARENKNKFVFAFCSLLVSLGVFRKVSSVLHLYV